MQQLTLRRSYEYTAAKIKWMTHLEFHEFLEVLVILEVDFKVYDGSRVEFWCLPRYWRHIMKARGCRFPAAVSPFPEVR